MMAGVREMLVITTPHDLGLFRALLGDGSQWGVSIDYAEQAKPAGIAQSYLIAEEFVAGENSALILGDNLFYGQGLIQMLKSAAAFKSGAVVFGHRVANPQHYGVLQFDADRKPVDILEKPKVPPSNVAVTGLYFYDGRASSFAAELTPSARGELEITDLNRAYLARGELEVQEFGRGIAWLDTGTPESLIQAAQFVEILEQRQGFKIAVPEEVAWRLGYIDDSGLAGLAGAMGKCDYAAYLKRLLDSE